MPRKLRLGLTGSKHKNKKLKVVTDELDQQQAEQVVPCELTFDDIDPSEIDQEVKNVLNRLINQVRNEHKVAWSKAWCNLLDAASDYNDVSFAVQSLSQKCQGLACSEPYVRWRKCVKGLLAASGRQLRVEQRTPGFGWCMLLGGHVCLCKREPCLYCDLPCIDPPAKMCWLWEPGNCECDMV